MMRSRLTLRLETSTATRPSSERMTSVRPESDSTTPLISIHRRSSVADVGMATGPGATMVSARLDGAGAIVAARTGDAVGALMMFGPAVPLVGGVSAGEDGVALDAGGAAVGAFEPFDVALVAPGAAIGDRKSTRLNSSHPSISYAVFC